MLIILKARGAWVAQSVEHPISAQVMISRSMSSSPMSGSVLTARSLEPASDSVSSSLSALPQLCSVSLSLSKINKHLKKLKIELLYDPAIALLGIYPKDTGVLIQRGTFTPMFIAAQSTTAKLWKEPTCPSTDE